MHGVPEYVLVRGRICVENGSVRVAEGFGRFVPTPLKPAFVYDSIEGKSEEQQVEQQNGNGSSKIAELDAEITAPVPPAVMFSSKTTPSTPEGARGRVDGKRDLQESSFSISRELQQLIEYPYI